MITSFQAAANRLLLVGPVSAYAKIYSKNVVIGLKTARNISLQLTVIIKIWIPTNMFYGKVSYMHIKII